MEHLTGGASPESSGDNNTLSHPGGSQRHPTSGSSDNSQLPTRHVGGPVFDNEAHVQPFAENRTGRTARVDGTADSRLELATVRCHTELRAGARRGAAARPTASRPHHPHTRTPLCRNLLHLRPQAMAMPDSPSNGCRE